MPKRILITNDDGIASEGIYSLYNEIKKIGRVYVVAPDSEQSGMSHAITVKNDIRVQKYYKNGEFFGYAVGGTPADCVKLGIMKLIPPKIDLIISGINHGENTGLNIMYSGTVSAAIEATILGIPAFAISLGMWKKSNFSVASEISRIIAGKVLKMGLPEGSFLNINVPPVQKKHIKGIRITQQGNEKFDEYYTKKIKKNPTHTYYRLNGKRKKVDKKLETEQSAIHRYEISITPIHYDMTDYSMIEKINKWNVNLD